MTDDLQPTPNDLDRDLFTDLMAIYQSFKGSVPREALIAGVAIRRALAAEARVKELEVELATLRAQNLAHADALSRTAERDALTRLGAWKQGGRSCSLVDGPPNYPSRVVLIESPGLKVIACPTQEAADYCTNQSGGEPCAIAVGTDAEPATLAQVIHAALDAWEKQHGEKGEG